MADSLVQRQGAQEVADVVPIASHCSSEDSISNPDQVQAGVVDSLPDAVAYQSNFQLMVLDRTVYRSKFNALQLGAETPIAPGRGENWSFGERFGRSFRSRSPECARQTHGKLGVFQVVSPAESGSHPERWRRIGNRDRKLSVQSRGHRSSHCSYVFQGLTTVIPARTKSSTFLVTTARS